MSIPQKDIWQFRECFDWFDKDSDGRIKGVDLPNALRAMGQHWSFHDLQELQKEFPPQRDIDFPLYLSIAERRYGLEPDTNKLGQAFDILDRVKSGKVFADDVKHLLTSVGEKLTEGEFKELCAISGYPYRGENQTFNKDQFMRIFGAYQQK